jgi:hypothetical protein
VAISSTARDALLHDYLRCELRINQHDVGTDGADLVEAIVDRAVMSVNLVIVDDRVRAELPQNEVRLGMAVAGHVITPEPYACLSEWERRGKVRDSGNAVWYARIITYMASCALQCL